MNYKLFLILKLDWINSDVQLLMLMFLTLLSLLDLHQITMIISCMWCSVYYLFCLTKPKWLDGVFTFPTRAKNGWLSIALACSSYAETAQCWSPLRIGLNGLNAFCWGRASTDHSLHALCRGPLAFVSPNNDGIGAPLLGKNHCSLWPMGTHQMDVYLICEFLCICVCVNGNAKVNACEVNISFTPSVCIYSVTKKGGDVTPRESQSHISCLDLCQAFWLVRL